MDEIWLKLWGIVKIQDDISRLPPWFNQKWKPCGAVYNQTCQTEWTQTIQHAGETKPACSDRILRLSPPQFVLTEQILSFQETLMVISYYFLTRWRWRLSSTNCNVLEFMEAGCEILCTVKHKSAVREQAVCRFIDYQTINQLSALFFLAKQEIMTQSRLYCLSSSPIISQF